MKLYKREWKKYSETLNAWVEKDRWERTLIIEHTGFFPRHVGARGLNHNESTLLDFGKRYIEAKSVYFATSDSCMKAFVNSTVHSNEAGTYIEIRKNGKTHCVTIHDGDDDAFRWFGRALGAPCEFYAAEFADFCVQFRESDAINIQSGRRVQLDDAELKRMFNKENTKIDLFQAYAQEEFKQTLVKAGFKVLTFFRFTHTIALDGIPHTHSIGWHDVNFIKKTSRGVQFGWRSFGTYNNLPNVVSIQKAKGVPSVKLRDLGIEGKGYYSHDQQCSIPKSQAKAAKQFFQRAFPKVASKC